MNNRQSELSRWWGPGPFTLALAWSHTATGVTRANPLGGSESRDNEHTEIALIGRFSF